MKQIIDIMLDIETFGTSNDAAIVSIGAVAFQANDPCVGTALFDLTECPKRQEGTGDAFHVKVDLSATPEDQRGLLDPGSVEWWLTQSDEARAALLGGDRMYLRDALSAFSDWIDNIKHVYLVDEDSAQIRLWSNGPTFDEVIVRSAFRRCNLEFPLSFRASRCCRTSYEDALMLGWKPQKAKAEWPDDILKHDAMHDAIFQARSVVSQRAHMLASWAIRNCDS